MKFEQQRNKVEQILNKVANDSPTDASKRLITFSRNASNCKPFINEDYAVFEDRFRRVAQWHLNCFVTHQTHMEKGKLH